MRVEISDADATILDFEIGRASLKDIQSKLGNAKIERLSRDQESDVEICYLSPTDGTILIFYSGAMGGWRDLTRFALWSREAAFRNASHCTESAEISRNLSTGSGLRLGLTKAQLKEIVSAPTSVAPFSAKYEYTCRQKMTNEEIRKFKAANNWDVIADPYFDRMSWIEVHFISTTASRIEVGRIESY